MDWPFWLAILVMLIGLAGTILPLLPGTPIIFLAILGYGLYTHFTTVGIWFILIMGLLTGLSFAVDYLGTAYGAKRYGATRYGVWGSIIGGVLGLFVLPPFGLVLGTLLGAITGELIRGAKAESALSIGWGSLVGFLGGSILKIILAAIMVVSFVVKTI
ncbi:MAG TPA: DUF456 domain-containing protein [Verrucomicrobiae bacterium]|nr:DUF456 domain-containing protein [Verrucomicrobiae bacterium]